MPLAALLAAAILAIQAPAPEIEDQNDWPTYNHDSLGWRHNSAEGALGVGNAGTLVELWRFPSREVETIGVVHATPSIVDGCAYFGTATNPTFYKLSPEGKLVWFYRNPKSQSVSPAGSAVGGITDKLRFQSSSEGIMTSALVTRDAVFFGDLGGWVYSLDRETGRERWKVNTRAKDFPGAHAMNVIFASPVFAEGHVIIGGGALEQLVAGGLLYAGSTGRGFLVALDPADGRVVWKYDVGPRPEKLDPPIVIEDSWGKHRFFFGPATSTVWSTPSYDRETATVYFGTDVNTAPRRPTADQPNLYTRESCAIVALDARDGRERWVTQISPEEVWTNAMRGYDPMGRRYKDGAVGDTPKVFTISLGGRAVKVVGAGCKNGGFYVLDASDGRIVAQTPIYRGAPMHPIEPSLDPRILALPSVIGGLQTGCATDGKSIFVNGIDAVRLGTMENMLESGAPPTAGRVTSLSCELAVERWRHERPKVHMLGGPPPKPVYKDAGDPVASGIAIANGVVYFTTVASGKLVALNAASGAVIKEIDVGPVWSGPAVSRGRVYVGTGNTLFNAADYEAFFPKRYTGDVRCFGLASDGTRESSAR
jgi:outer membrane protein assembly factor BamB